MGMHLEKSKRNFYIIAILSFILSIEIIWFLRDSSPLMWDSALHFANIYKFRLFFLSGNFSFLKFLKLESLYPPLFYLLENIIFLFIPISIKGAKILNVIFLVLIFFASYKLSKEILKDERKALFSAFLVSLSPHVLWTSRDVVLEDGTLFFMILTIYFLLKSEFFKSKKFSIISGISLGFSFIFKWTELFVLFFPILYLIYFSFYIKRDSIKERFNNFLNFVLITLLIIFPWYGVNFKYLYTHFVPFSQGLGQVEGDPARFTLYYFTYYLRTLLSHHLFIYFFILFLIGFFYWFKSENKYKFLIFWMILGPYLVLTFFSNKAYRHILYVIPAIMILISNLLFNIKRKWLRRGIIFFSILIAVFQALVISFHIFPFIPNRCVLKKEKSLSFRERILIPKGVVYITKFKDYHDDICCYVRNEFDLWGPPKRENWHIDDILSYLKDIDKKFSLGLVFDHRYLNVWCFRDYALLKNLNCYIWRISTISNIKKFRYVLIKDGNQGPIWDTTENAKIMSEIKNSAKFKFLRSWKMPDGYKTYLYLNLKK